MANIKECKVVLLRQSIDSCKKGDIIKIVNDSIVHIAPEDNPMCPSYHLYFVIDDKISKGDWYVFNNIGGSPIVGKATRNIIHTNTINGFSKIVASTNTSLGLQDIPETFIKHYVESNGSIKTVKIESTNRDKDIIVGYVSDKDVNKPIDYAHEYVENIMGAPYGYYTQHRNKELFNDLVNAYRAGQQNNYASEMISRIITLKPSLIENIQRHDWRNALEIIDLMFTSKQEPESPTDKKEDK